MSESQKDYTMKTLKLSRKTIFKQAHEAAKDLNKKGDCYAVTFAACLKLAYANASVDVACVSRELLLSKGGKEWEKGDNHRVYFAPAFGEKGVYFDLKTNEMTIQTQDALFVEFVILGLIAAIESKSKTAKTKIFMSKTKFADFLKTYA